MLTSIFKTLTEIMGGRSTQFAWAAFIAGTVLCGYGKLTGAEYVALVTLLTGVVSARAVAQDKIVNGNGKNSGTVAPAPDLSRINS